MDDKTPTSDQTPDPIHGSTPDSPTVPVAPTSDAAAPAPTPASASAPAPAPAPTAEAAAPAKPRRRRALLIGGGIAAAVVLAGGGVAVGAAIGDEFGDDDDRPSMSDGSNDDERGGQPAGPRGEDRDDDDQRGPSDGGGPVTGIGTASADELIAIADAARGAAEGEVTSIDAKRDGTWEVQLTTADGAETEVRVDADLATSIVSTDAADGDDTGPTLSLDEATIRSLVTAALDEAEGMITDLDVDADDVSPYDASVLTTDNRSIDIDFGADFAVVGTDAD